MRRTKKLGAVRLFSRLAMTLAAAAVFALVSVQFARILKENIVMAHSLHSVRSSIERLRERKVRDEHALRRLLNDEGSVPEIHGQLRMVRRNEAIIYLKPAPTPNP